MNVCSAGFLLPINKNLGTEATVTVVLFWLILISWKPLL